MTKVVSGLLGVVAIASAAFAGTETYSGKEMKQVVPPPCPQWYTDNEFNLSLWGTYVFTGNEWGNDRYLEADHAWGGGGDLKSLLPSLLRCWYRRLGCRRKAVARRYLCGLQRGRL